MARVTVEDSLKVVPSRFSLVHVASQRGRQLLRGAHPLVESNNRSIVTALREIAAAKVNMMDQDELCEMEAVVKEKPAPVEAKAKEPKAKAETAKEVPTEEVAAEK